MNSTTTKIVIGVVIIVGIGGFIYWSSSASNAANPTASDAATSAGSETTNPNSSATTTASSGSTGTTGSTTASGTYKDGTYTGTAANSIYGNVQVSAKIAGGKLTDVTFLQAPNNQPHSVDVTNMSEPILKSEAIASQNANVDIVSGATQTSQAFQASLQSALSQAQA